MKVDDVLARLCNVKRSGDGWTARCPTHDDQHNSLTINDARNGKILLFCHANSGCTYTGIINALGLDFTDGQRGTQQDVKSYRPDSEATAIYDYLNEQGKLLYQVLRFDNPKDFRPRVPDGNGGFKRGLPKEVRRVLYRLPEILASDSNTPIFIVEGEKDVEALRELGLIATCNVGGAGKWREEYNDALHDRHICILPDHDQPGIKHARKVARSLFGVAASVRIVDLFAINNKEVLK